MRRATAKGLVLLGLGVAAVWGGCGANTTGVQPPAAAPGPTPAACASPTTVALTVKNYLSWCAVTVSGQAASTAVSQTVCVAPGPVALSATALPGFQLGQTPWHDTDGDHGAGDAGILTGGGASAASAAQVTVTGTSACVWVCCPLANGSGCPVTDACP